jgi:hypothetical protein
MAITIDPKHRMKRVHVIPFDGPGEYYFERKSNLKRVKGPLKKTELSTLEKQGLQALLSLHSDVHLLTRQDVDTRHSTVLAKKCEVSNAHSSCLVSGPSNKLDTLKHRNKKQSAIRFLGDPLAVPSPPPPPFIGKPLAVPPPLPRVPYGYVFEARHYPDNTESS